MSRVYIIHIGQVQVLYYSDYLNSNLSLDTDLSLDTVFDQSRLSKRLVVSASACHVIFPHYILWGVVKSIVAHGF